MDDTALLREYSSHGSEKAFAELVSRHIDLVYSAAVRQVGDAHRAQDVTQAVFVLLAQKARTLSKDVILSGWLYRTARYVAADVLRVERRRQLREQKAMETMADESGDTHPWEEIAPLLDAAMAELETKDRDAIVLRFFAGKSLREVGEQLGASEEAAQKRVSRAVEKLRQSFAQQGRSVSIPVLTAAISTYAVQAAPIGLTAIATSAALSAGATVTTSTLTWGTLKLMAWTKLQTATAIGIVGLTTTVLVVQHNRLKQLEADNARLAHSLTQNAVAAKQASFDANQDELDRLRKEAAEIHKLRGEVVRLRQEQTNAVRLATENAKLREQVSTATAEQAEEDSVKEQEKALAIAKMNFTKSWMMAMYRYASEKNLPVPNDMEAVRSYMDPTIAQTFPADKFEVVYQGKLEEAPDPARTIVLREREVTITSEGKRVKAYGFADGHSEIMVEPARGFEAWEQERMPAARVKPANGL